MKVELTPAQARLVRSVIGFVLAGEYLAADGGPLQNESQAEALRRTFEKLGGKR